MNRFARIVLLSMLVLIPFQVFADGPVVPLMPEQFDYGDEAYIGQQLGFGTYANYSTLNIGDSSANLDFTSELSGYVVPIDQVGDVSSFTGGGEFDVLGKTPTDIFGETTPPSNVTAFDIGISVAGSGDTLGFTSIALNQKGILGLDDGPANADFSFAELYAQLVFEVEQVSSEPPAPAIVDLLFFVDALAGLFDDGGDVSQGFNLQVLDLTDVHNPMLMNEIEGFYFIDDDENFGDASSDDDDVSDQFMFSPSSLVTGAQDIAFQVELELLLQPGNVYGFNLYSDLGASALGAGADGGSVFLDSSNTLGFSLTVADPQTTRLVVPSSVPEPASVLLILMGASCLCSSRSRILR